MSRAQRSRGCEAAAFYGCYDWHSSVHGHWPTLCSQKCTVASLLLR